MFDIHVVSPENRSIYADVLHDYHRERYRVFVEEKGWRGLSPEDGLEKDQFDDDDAIYVITTAAGGVVAGMRFHPTTTPHMLDTVFAYLTRGTIPTGRHIWEATRYFVKRSRRAGAADAVMLAASYQFCLEEGISYVTAVLETASLSRWMQAGLKLMPLGLPHDVDGESVTAVVSEMTEEGFAAMLRKRQAKPLNLIRRGIEIGSIGDRIYAR